MGWRLNSSKIKNRPATWLRDLITLFLQCMRKTRVLNVSREASYGPCMLEEVMKDAWEDAGTLRP